MKISDQNFDIWNIFRIIYHVPTHSLIASYIYTYIEYHAVVMVRFHSMKREISILIRVAERSLVCVLDYGSLSFILFSTGIEYFRLFIRLDICLIFHFFLLSLHVFSFGRFRFATAVLHCFTDNYILHTSL